MRGDKDEQSGEAAKVAQEPFAGITVADFHPTVNVGFMSSRVKFDDPAARLALSVFTAEFEQRLRQKLSDEAVRLLDSKILPTETFEEVKNRVLEDIKERKKRTLEYLETTRPYLDTLMQPSSEPATAASGEAKAHVSAEFPPRAVVHADVDVLAAGSSSLAVETLGDEGRRRLIAAFRAVMAYDVTQDAVWEEISKLGRATRLYMCDPEPKSFVVEDGQRITGRGSILVDYRAEILPGQERDVSVSVPARFHLHCRNGVPEIDRVELRN